MSAVMYGMPPAFPPMPTLPDPLQPTDVWPLTFVTTGTPREVEPETAETIARRLDARIAWLENELRMHEAWKTELAVLRRMREAGTPTSTDGGVK